MIAVCSADNCKLDAVGKIVLVSKPDTEHYFCQTHIEEDINDLTKCGFKFMVHYYENSVVDQTIEEYAAKVLGEPGQVINELARIIHGNAKAAGWWDEDRCKFTTLLLAITEIAEAVEGVRKDTMDSHLPYFTTETVEIADAIIRLLDHAGRYKLPVGQAILEKIKYNQTRADHRPENRAKPGGKKV